MKIKSSIRHYSIDFVNNEKIINKFYDFFIIDVNVYLLHLNKFKRINKNSIIFIDALEKNKEYVACADIIKKLIDAGVKRGNTICAIGGGIVQDIAGFITSILYRGIDWVFYPTTLLSQCDSCIGGKTSINLGEYKNLVGNFNPPKQIIIDTSYLKTLIIADIQSGIGEIIKVALLDSKNRISYKRIIDCIETNMVDNKIVKDALTIKKEIIEIDEFDKGLRNIMNFGHTFGHAIESLTKFKIPHGISVGLGISIANNVSYQLGHSRPNQNIDKLISAFELKNKVFLDLFKTSYDSKEYIKILSHDKKNLNIDEICCIIKVDKGYMKTGIKKEILKKCINRIMKGYDN